MTDNDDLLLLHRLKGGCLLSYGQLFRKYYKLLNMQAYYILKDDMEAEDQVQSLFIEIWDKQLYRHINTSVKSYLLAAIRNKCLTVIKKKKVSGRRLDAYVYTMKDDQEKNLVIESEFRNNVQAVLNELPSQRLQAFVLVYMEDKKYKEAAEAMDISINSVKTHIKLALKELRMRFLPFR